MSRETIALILFNLFPFVYSQIGNLASMDDVYFDINWPGPDDYQNVLDVRMISAWSYITPIISLIKSCFRLTLNDCFRFVRIPLFSLRVYKL